MDRYKESWGYIMYGKEEEEGSFRLVHEMKC